MRTGSWPPALFIQGLYRNISIKYTVSNYTNQQNFLSLSKSWVWAMPTLLSDNTFQYTHIHVACREFLVTRRDCSPCIMSDSYCGFSFSMLSPFFFPTLSLPVFSLNSYPSPVLASLGHLHFRSFSRLNITVMLAASRLNQCYKMKPP